MTSRSAMRRVLLALVVGGAAVLARVQPGETQGPAERAPYLDPDLAFEARA